MQQFLDYIFLGSFFILFALYWILKLALVLEDRRQKGIRVRRWKFGYRAELREQQTPSSSSKVQTETKEPKGCKLHIVCPHHRRWPLPGILKISCGIIGFAGEICAAFPKGIFKYVEDIQLASVYGMLILSGVVDILYHWNILFPKGTSNFVLALTFGVETLQFLDAENKTHLEKEMQHLLIWTVLMCVFSTLAEMRFSLNLPLKFARSYFVLLQGFWLLQMGFFHNSIASNIPGLSQFISNINKSGFVLSWVSLILSWHVVGTFVLTSILAAVAVLIKRKSKCCWRSTSTWGNGGSEEVEATPSVPDDWEEREPLRP
ncbi:transmembrane protein 45B-like [Tachypleus tridentatus]|uniref:transmembrane protein 45B-like n=1 Tax=Tachypleus tridentatus TaxID=6853 RepID=UPI003FD013D7